MTGGVSGRRPMSLSATNADMVVPYASAQLRNFSRSELLSLILTVWSFIFFSLIHFVRLNTHIIVHRVL